MRDARREEGEREQFYLFMYLFLWNSYRACLYGCNYPTELKHKSSTQNLTSAQVWIKIDKPALQGRNKEYFIFVG